MSWYNGGVYEGLTVSQLRYVLAQFCWAVNERQVAVRMNPTQWTAPIPDKTYPAFSDLTNVLVGTWNDPRCLNDIITEIRDAIHAWLVPDATDVEGYPSGWTPPLGTKQCFGRVYPEDPITPLTITEVIGEAGYGTAWLGLTYHTNWRIYDQIKKVLEFLVHTRGKSVSPPWNQSYAQLGPRIGDTQEIAWDNAIAGTGTVGETPTPTHEIISRHAEYYYANPPGYFIYQAEILGPDGTITLNNPLDTAGTFVVGEVFVDSADGLRGSTHTLTNIACPSYSAFDEDANEYPSVAGSGITEHHQKFKSAAFWSVSQPVLTLTQTIPPSHPFNAFSTTSWQDRAFFVRSDGLLGFVRRQLGVGNGLTYG